MSCVAHAQSSTSLYTEMPGAVFFDLDNPSSSAPLGPLVLVVGSQIVNITSSDGLGNSPDFYGTFTCPSHREIPRNYETDPGNLNGYFSIFDATNPHTILDFDVPLSAFGVTFALYGGVGAQQPDLADTIYAYDGPGATGNLIATVSTAAHNTVASFLFDFVGVYTDGAPTIRSVLIAGGPLGQPSQVAFTGFALAVGSAPPCLADTNGDGMLSPADFSAWVAAFNAMTPACDQNGDGACTPADFSAWVSNFNAGC